MIETNLGHIDTFDKLCGLDTKKITYLKGSLRLSTHHLRSNLAETAHKNYIKSV